MSIATDIKTRADEVAKQGRKAGKNVVDAAQSQLTAAQAQLSAAQTQFTELTDAVAGNVTVTVNDLRAQAEKTVEPYVTRVNKTVEPYVTRVNKTVEPYVSQAKGYADTARARAEELFGAVTSDKRVAKVVDTAQALTDTVTETVQIRVVTPVRHLTGTAKPAAKKPAAKASAAKPAAKKPAAKASAAKPAAKKAAAKATPRKRAAAKAPAASAE